MLQNHFEAEAVKGCYVQKLKQVKCNRPPLVWLSGEMLLQCISADKVPPEKKNIYIKTISNQHQQLFKENIPCLFTTQQILA